MAVVAKMRVDTVKATGGGWHGPLCQGESLVESWPPPTEQLSSGTYYGHGEGECSRCDELAESLPQLDGDHHARSGVVRSLGVPGKGMEEVRLGAVASGGENDPNREWAASTPSGTLELTIANPGAWGFFKPGVEYLVTIREHHPQKGRRGDSA